MKTQSAAIRLFSILLALAAAACAGPAAVTTDNEDPEVTSVEATAPEDADRAELEALYWRKIESSRTFTEADVNFMKGMIAHHAQALIMSDLADDNGASSQVQTLAARIINAQRDEIRSMQTWLRDRGQAVPEVHIDGLNLMVHGVAEHHHHMPGMLTRAQLEELAAARGAEFDRLFLTYMIEHHSGAVHMVDELFDVDGAAQDDTAFKLASDIHVDQITEIERMELMLDNLAESGGGR